MELYLFKGEVVEFIRKFVKRPVQIEAVRFVEVSRTKRKFGDSIEYNDSQVAQFMGRIIHVRTVPNGEPQGRTFVEISTREGVMEANVGDWIIKGIQGEFYPCKPDIFDKTYEELEV